MAAMFTLAHISDPHLAPLPAPPIGSLIGKRLMGYLSWQMKRRKIHRTEVLDALTRDLKGQDIDHLVITGDLTNISLSAEFSAVARWLSNLGPADEVTVIPGNHDAYVPLDWAKSWEKWKDYMAGERDHDAGPRPPEHFDDFPFMRIRGPIALIGTSSARPSPPAFAIGTLGERQLERIASLLETARSKGLCRMVLVHHPPAGLSRWRKRLTDAEAFCRVIRQHGAELVLHGHDHSFSEVSIDGPEAPVPVFGIPSASAALAHGHRPVSHYGIFGIEAAESGWNMQLRYHGFDRSTKTFKETASHTRHLPAAGR